MFYEGTEKRLEITLKQNVLMTFPELFWQAMVEQAGAFILSKIENEQISAYLLSESSLFIWQNKLLLITCGNTHLVRAAQFFQKKIAKENIQSLLFHRHQPVQPQLQKSDFAQDSLLLNSHLQGITQHWQGKYQGDLFFFGESAADAYSKRILMLHGLSGPFASMLQTGEASTEEIEATLAVVKFFPKQLFPDLLIDQFTFNPKGYSLNAIDGYNYLTIHITPERLSTYLSLESSFPMHILQPFINHLLALFHPLQSNLMFFNQEVKGSLQIGLTEPQLS